MIKVSLLARQSVTQTPLDPLSATLTLQTRQRLETRGEKIAIMETKYLISFFFKLKKFNKTIPSHSVLLTGVKATRNDFQQGLEYSGGWKTSC